MTHDDDFLARRLRDDAATFTPEPRADLRRGVLARLADERRPRLPRVARAMSLAAALLICAAAAWWLAPRAPERSPAASDAVWVVETIDENPAALTVSDVAVAEAPAPSRERPLVPDVPWIGGGGDPASWARVMAHPFDSEWQRMKADVARAGDVVWDRVARPLAAVFRPRR